MLKRIIAYASVSLIAIYAIGGPDTSPKSVGEVLTNADYYLKITEEEYFRSFVIAGYLVFDDGNVFLQSGNTTTEENRLRVIIRKKPLIILNDGTTKITQSELESRASDPIPCNIWCGLKESKQVNEKYIDAGTIILIDLPDPEWPYTKHKSEPAGAINSEAAASPR